VRYSILASSMTRLALSIFAPVRLAQDWARSAMPIPQARDQAIRRSPIHGLWGGVGRGGVPTASAGLAEWFHSKSRNLPERNPLETLNPAPRLPHVVSVESKWFAKPQDLRTNCS
jgi:hypothetical protein